MTFDPSSPAGPSATDGGLELDLAAVPKHTTPQGQRPRPPSKAMYLRMREEAYKAENNVRAVGALILLQGVSLLLWTFTNEGQYGMRVSSLAVQTSVAFVVMYIGGSLRQLKTWARHAGTVGLVLWLGSRVIQLSTRGLDQVLEQGVAIGLAVFSLYALREPRSNRVFEDEYRNKVIPNTPEFKSGSAYARITLGLAVGLGLFYASLVLFADQLGR